MNRKSKPLAIIGAVAAALVLIIIVVMSNRSSSGDASSDQGAASEQTTSTTGTGPALGETTSIPPVDASGTAQPGSGAATPRPEAPIPVDVQVSSTDHLTDGQPITVRVTPQAGSEAFGVEAFLCAADATYQLDADIRPTQTGKCVTKPLSAESNDYVRIAAPPPYDGFDLTFKAGVGSDSYATQRGETVTIICGPGHPCQLVLKLQYPNGFGFRSYPLTYR